MEFERFYNTIVSNKFIEGYGQFLIRGKYIVGQYTDVYDEVLVEDLNKLIKEFKSDLVAKIIYSIYYSNKGKKERYLSDLEKFIVEYSKNEIKDNNYFINKLQIWR